MIFLHDKNHGFVVIKPSLGAPMCLLVHRDVECPGVAFFTRVDGVAVGQTALAQHVHLGNASKQFVKIELTEPRLAGLLTNPGELDVTLKIILKQMISNWKQSNPSYSPERVKQYQKAWRELHKSRKLERAKEACRNMIKMMRESAENYTGFQIASGVARHFSNRQRLDNRADGRGRYLKPILDLHYLVEVFEEVGQPYEIEHLEMLYHRPTRDEDAARAKEARARRAEIREKMEKDQEAFVWNNNSEPAKHNG